VSSAQPLLIKYLVNGGREWLKFTEDDTALLRLAQQQFGYCGSFETVDTVKSAGESRGTAADLIVPRRRSRPAPYFCDGGPPMTRSRTCARTRGPLFTGARPPT
jgi:hypothetical protein